MYKKKTQDKNKRTPKYNCRDMVANEKDDSNSG